jgi:hypothetical protein
VFFWSNDRQLLEDLKVKLSQIDASVGLLISHVINIQMKENKIMADIQNLSDDLDAIKAGVDAAIVLIAELKAQIAAIPAGAATQEQLDALDAKTEAIKAALAPPVE